MAKKLIDKSIPRFLMVGVLNTLVGAGVMFLLFNLAGWAYWTASAANYVVGGVLSYFLNKHFTFQNKERGWARWQIRPDGSGVLAHCLRRGQASGAVGPLRAEREDPGECGPAGGHGALHRSELLRTAVFCIP